VALNTHYAKQTDESYGMKHSMAKVTQVRGTEVQGLETGCFPKFDLNMDLGFAFGAVAPASLCWQ
jgi:hypothetical protein